MIRLILCIALISGFMASTACAQGKTELAKGWLEFYAGGWSEDTVFTEDGAIRKTTATAQMELVAGGNAVVAKREGSDGKNDVLFLRLDEDGKLDLSAADSVGLVWKVQFAEVTKDKLIGEIWGAMDGVSGTGKVSWTREGNDKIVYRGDVKLNNGGDVTWVGTATRK